MEDSGESGLPDVEATSHPNSLTPECPMEVGTEGTPTVASGDNLTVSPKEDEMLTGDQTHAEGQSPTSDTASMAGELARLHVHSPPHQESEDDKTSQ